MKEIAGYVISYDTLVVSLLFLIIAVIAFVLLPIAQKVNKKELKRGDMVMAVDLSILAVAFIVIMGLTILYYMPDHGDSNSAQIIIPIGD